MDRHDFVRRYREQAEALQKEDESLDEQIAKAKSRTKEGLEEEWARRVGLLATRGVIIQSAPFSLHEMCVNEPLRDLDGNQTSDEDIMNLGYIVRELQRRIRDKKKELSGLKAQDYVKFLQEEMENGD